jgi:hypothetical protein
LTANNSVDERHFFSGLPSRPNGQFHSSGGCPRAPLSNALRQITAVFCLSLVRDLSILDSDSQISTALPTRRHLHCGWAMQFSKKLAVYYIGYYSRVGGPVTMLQISKGQTNHKTERLPVVVVVSDPKFKRHAALDFGYKPCMFRSIVLSRSNGFRHAADIFAESNTLVSCRALSAKLDSRDIFMVLDLCAH